jgi:hypothetical protein
MVSQSSLPIVPPAIPVRSPGRHATWRQNSRDYDITGPDVWAAYNHAMKAACNLGCESETLARIRDLVASEASGGRFVTKILGRELGLS